MNQILYKDFYFNAFLIEVRIQALKKWFTFNSISYSF